MKTALITGAGKGIGFATAKKFLYEGYNVIISGRSEERLNVAAAKLDSERCKVLKWDISSVDDGKSVIETASALFGTIDVFVNNAGVVTEEDLKGTELTEKTVNAWDKVMDTNLKGTYFAIQAQADYMIKRKIKGHIVNVCSEMGFRGASTAYGISKWGVRAMTMGLGKSLIKYGIVLNGIAPGETATEMVGNINGLPKEIDSPRGIQAKTSEIADAIYFLATQDNVVGEVLLSDGGRSIN